MTETADELRLIESICSHLHTTHSLHLAVHFEELVTGYLNLKVGLVAIIGMERFLMNFNCQRLRRVRRGMFERRRVSGGLDRTKTKLGLVKVSAYNNK